MNGAALEVQRALKDFQIRPFQQRPPRLRTHMQSDTPFPPQNLDSEPTQGLCLAPVVSKD